MTIAALDDEVNWSVGEFLVDLSENWIQSITRRESGNILITIQFREGGGSWVSKERIVKN